MDDAVRVREATEEALADIDPERLRETLYERLADAEMTPGVLTLRSARALSPDADVIGVGERAAGVQLIYEGLRLTRSLSQDAPWERLDGDGDGSGHEGTPPQWIDTGSEAIAADLEVLAADVFVARGFYLLARTEAAHDAVEVVQRFGRDQTLRRSAPDPSELDRNLEADVFELAVIAGTSAVGSRAPEGLRSYAADLTRETEGLPAVRALPGGVDERIASLVDDERVASSADS
jgi:hypothetical protein